MEEQFQYSKAVVCGIPASLPAAALRQNEAGEPVDLQKAKEQHEQYVEVLRSLIPEVVCCMLTRVLAGHVPISEMVGPLNR